MRWRRFTALRNVAVFAAAMLLCLFAPTAFRNSAGGLFEEFRAPLDAIPSQLGDLEKFWSLSSNSKRELIEAGRDLARLNSAYELKMRENQILRDRLSRLEKILNLPSQEKFKMEVARVCRRDISAWWQHITIRKGKRHGIREGYAVICGGGVVGRVVKVDSYTSVVELASSRKFRMAAHIEGDERPIIYQGAGSLSIQGAHGEVFDAPADLSASAKSPLRLVTSSLAGTFPEGILIGEVVSLVPEPDGIFKSGKVNLPESLSSLREVAVLVPVSQVKID